MIQQSKQIQGLYSIQNPFFVQHEQREDQNAGHGGNIKKDGFMAGEEKELHQHQANAQILIEGVRAKPRDMQEPDTEASHSHQRDHPQLP